MRMFLSSRNGHNNESKEFVNFIAEVIKDDVLTEVKKSKFYSLLINGSTDKCTIQQMALYAKYLKDGKVKELFLALLH